MVLVGAANTLEVEVRQGVEVFLVVGVTSGVKVQCAVDMTEDFNHMEESLNIMVYQISIVVELDTRLEDMYTIQDPCITHTLNRLCHSRYKVINRLQTSSPKGLAEVLHLVLVDCLEPIQYSL